MAAAPGDARTRTIRKTVGQSHSDLHRILPRVLSESSWQRTERGYTVSNGETILDIVLEPEFSHKIALLSIAQTTVEFRFSGWEGEQVDDFMARFNRAFQKGGG